MNNWPTSYAHFPDLISASGEFAIRPITWEDREPIRQWRNEQIDVLRQARPLSTADQDRYYRAVIRPQFEQENPAQILWGFEEDGSLIGYGGLVHIAWSDRRGEVSFLTETSRVSTSLAEDWTAFLGLLVPLARERLRFHKLTTETFAVRSALIPILEGQGFVLEGTLREHHQCDGDWVDSLAHGLLLN